MFSHLETTCTRDSNPIFCIWHPWKLSYLQRKNLHEFDPFSRKAIMLFSQYPNREQDWTLAWAVTSRLKPKTQSIESISLVLWAGWTFCLNLVLSTDHSAWTNSTLSKSIFTCEAPCLKLFSWRVSLWRAWEAAQTSPYILPCLLFLAMRYFL